MKKDIEIKEVQDVYVAAILEEDSNGYPAWYVYLINDKNHMIDGVMVTSKGYEDLNQPTHLKTSIMRHAIGHVPAKSNAKIELISPDVFTIYNEYWVTFFEENRLMEKKFIFGPHTIDKNFMDPIPTTDVGGVLVK